MPAKIGSRRPVRFIHCASVRRVAVAVLVTSLLPLSPSVAQSQPNQDKLDQVSQNLIGKWRANLSAEESWTLEFRNRDIVWFGGDEVVSEGATWGLEQVADRVFKVILNGESPDEQAMIIAFENSNRMVCPLPDGTRAMFDRLGGKAMLNHGFEIPEIGREGFQFVDTVPGWKTSDTEFEVWGTGFQGVKAYEGSQFVELNAHEDGTLFQDQSGIERDATIEFSFAHRGRNGDDRMRLTIADLGPDNVPGSGDDTVLFTKEYSTGTDFWAVYDSTTEPKFRAMGNTVRFAYTAVFGTGGTGPDKTEGNFLDAASFGVGVVAKRNTYRRFPLQPPLIPPFVVEESDARSPSGTALNLLGKYESVPPSSDWHYVTIEPGTGGNLRWVNRAGVAWTLEFRSDNELWSVKDSPYGEMKYEIKQDEHGNFTGLDVGGSFYRLVERSAPAPKLPAKFIVETYGVHGLGNTDQPKYFIGREGNQLKIVQATLEQALKNENGVKSITGESLDGGLVALKVDDSYLPDFATAIGDANKYQEVAPVFRPEAGEKDFISLQLANSPGVYLRHSSYRVFNGAMSAVDQPDVFRQDVTWHFHEVPSGSSGIVGRWLGGESVTIEFKSGNVFVVTTPDVKTQGTYKLEGSQLTMTSDGGETEENAVEFVNPNTIRLNGELELKRIQEAKDSGLSVADLKKQGGVLRYKGVWDWTYENTSSFELDLNERELKYTYITDVYTLPYTLADNAKGNAVLEFNLPDGAQSQFEWTDRVAVKGKFWLKGVAKTEKPITQTTMRPVNGPADR